MAKKRCWKKFKSFEEEEKWLMEMAQDGWRLVSYIDSDVDENSYKFVKDPTASEYHYQVDYRDFTKKSDYEEYRDLFAESGWTLLSKNRLYSKHIFISTTKSKIFSDLTSMAERDVTRYRKAKEYVWLFIILAIVSAILYYFFDYAYFGALTIFSIGATIYNAFDARKRYKKIHHINMGHYEKV